MRQLSIVTLILLTAGLAGAEELRFNRDVRPILSEKCFHCHGPDKNARQAMLRLDVRESAIERGAIQPGDPEASKLVQRIRPEKKALAMPPAWSNKSLDENEKAILERWVAEGAEYEPHWAYIPPTRPDASGIDELINRELAKRNLKPVGEADRRTLIRRLSFDLTGLPPTPSEVQAFIDDKSPDAYENLVDRLLASPQYGERMAVHWLDLVRYADSVGFHSDVPISVWPYRDYVIRSFQQNKPFDEFTSEQIAGDLLENPTPEQLVASAYNRINRMTNEGGAQELEYRVKYAADRVRTTSTVWLGSTMGCAECHDHKFDPFHQKDFYTMAAFFADIEEEGVYNGRAWWGPRIRVPAMEDAAELAAIEAELERLRTAPVNGTTDAGSEWRVARARSVTAKSMLRFKRQKDGSYLAKGDVPRADLHTVELKLKPGAYTAVRLEAFAAHEFLLSRFSAELIRKGRPRHVPIRLAIADHEEDRFRAIDTLDEEDHTGWGGCDRRQIAFLFTEPIQARGGDRLRLRLQYEGRIGAGVLGRFRVSLTDAKFPELPQTAASPLRVRELERRRAEILAAGGDCLITKVAPRRTVRVLARGNWMDESGEVVQAQAPHFLKQIKENGGAPTRLDLAAWLTDRENPLTARVFVNRLWTMFFGTGISKVLDDVGSQGEPPVNQDLLDWLAVELIESGWDVKHIVRTIAMSETYCRASQPSPELAKADPYNRLHGHQAMLRLDAEFVRDSVLAVSGLLNRRIGGPSAKPYQPAGYYRELNFPKRTYKADYNENQWRRGLYTHWQRTFLHPSLMAFDAPSREECTAQRPVSNTPLQSLVLLNDPTYVEAARAFAARILASGETGAAGRIQWAFQEAFSRDASDSEMETLAEFLDAELARLASEKRSSQAMLRVGIARRPPEADPTELAAWTSIARALFNKHEFLMRY